MIKPTVGMVNAFFDALPGLRATPDVRADVRVALAAVLAVVEREQVAPLRAVLERLLDPHACHYDHHGDCQEHGTGSERPCPHARAKNLLGWSAP